MQFKMLLAAAPILLLSACGHFGDYVPLSQQDPDYSSAGYAHLPIEQRVSGASARIDAALRTGTIDKDTAFHVKGQLYQVKEDWDRARTGWSYDQKELDRTEITLNKIERKVFSGSFNR